MFDVKKFQYNPIGTLKESSFHSTLKQWYREPGDKIEEPIDNYIIDIVRDNLLIEIQTSNFSSIRKKLQKLLENYRVRLIHPIVKDKWIINVDTHTDKIIHKRLSPKHGSYIDIFEELIRIPDMISHPNFTVELILVHIAEIRRNDGKGSWRRAGWSIHDKKLVRILERKIFYTPIDFLLLKPTTLRTPFTNIKLARSLKISLRLAQKMSYCLRKMGIIKVIGKKGKAFLFGYD
ncbi:MAG: hypothetical protein ACFFAE_22245 [Candidatus Hodarchaeota archaeon]